MVESKLSRPPEDNKSKIPMDGKNGQASKPKKYRGKKPQNNPSLEPKPKTDLQGRYTNLEGYTFDLGPRASDKFAITMKENDRYLVATNSDIFQLSIMTETASTFPDPDMPNITDFGTDRPKTDGDMTYLKNNNTNEAIRKKLRKKDVYGSDMHKIYNFVVGQTNEQLKEKVASDATLQAVNTDQVPIGYLMILKSLFFSNQSDQHQMRLLCLSTRRIYNTIQYFNNNTTDYLVRFLNSQKLNEACNVRLITKGIQDHVVNILFSLQNNLFGSLQEDEKKGA